MEISVRDELSPYEKAALSEIQEWKTPTLTWLTRTLKTANTPFDWLGDQAMKVPVVEWVFERVFVGIMRVVNDLAAKTVRTEAVFTDFEPPVQSLENIHPLDLEHPDKAVGFLELKYTAITLSHGAAAGAASIAGPGSASAAIVADVVALVGSNLRAVHEYATYYGFDISKQQERLFAFNVLGIASSPTDATKVAAMAHLVKIARLVAQGAAWRKLGNEAFVRVVQRIAKALAIRLTKGKLAQALPYAGIVVGGGFNAHYTSRVCDAAYFLYRERFLARKYGPNYIEVTVPPSSVDDFGSGYETSWPLPSLSLKPALTASNKRLPPDTSSPGT